MEPKYRVYLGSDCYSNSLCEFLTYNFPIEGKYCINGSLIYDEDYTDDDGFWNVLMDFLGWYKKIDTYYTEWVNGSYTTVDGIPFYMETLVFNDLEIIFLKSFGRISWK